MKKTIFLFLFSFALNLLVGQRLAPFQLNDKEGIAINNDVLQTIIGKTWHIYKRAHYNRTLITNTIAGTSLVLHPDQTFQQMNIQGEWTIRQQKILHLTAKNLSQQEKNSILLGGFAIHHCSKDSLILMKTLTSNSDNLRLYYFEPEDQHKKRRPARVVKFSPSQKKFTEEELEKMSKRIREQDWDREQIIQEIKMEAFMRGIKIKENLFDYSEKDLINYLEKITKN